MHQTGTKAPDSITVDGKPYSLQHGKIFLFFYDPNCGHCDAAARTMSGPPIRCSETASTPSLCASRTA